MKLFTRTITDYVVTLIDNGLAAERGRELRVFAQSMPPGAVYQIFQGVSEALAVRTAHVRCEMRVARGLYEHWLETGCDKGECARLLEHAWIDTDDRLTHYRNLACSGDEDLLLVMLVGIDHATDRGGLADFYTLTDDLIYRDHMGGSYEGWIGQALYQANLSDVTGSGVREFDRFLKQLFQLRPRSLVTLSEFLSDVLLPQSESCDNASDFLGLAFENLPFWGLPPLFSPADPARRIAFLTEAAKIFTRDVFRDKRERNKALERIENPNHKLGVVPQTRGGVDYENVDDFISTLASFVERGGLSERERLLQTDFYVVAKLLQLKRKDRAKSKTVRDQTLRGASLQVLLHAIYLSLHEFVGSCGRNWAPGQLHSVKVEIESFEFDGTENDQEEDPASAEEVFRGLVGGLDKFLADFKISVRARLDDDKELIEIPIHLGFGYLNHDVAIKSRRLKESRLRFRVHVIGKTSDLAVKRGFVWALPPHHEERVRLTCARLIEKEMHDQMMRLPVVHLDSTLDELYFALDDGEAHRMFANGLSNAECRDVLSGLPVSDLGGEIDRALAELSAAYFNFVGKITEDGYFAAIGKPLRDLVRTYQSAVDLALSRDEQRLAHGGGLLRRLYQAFFCVPAGTSMTSAYVPCVLATGITPSIAETVQAREIFLRDGFVQVARILLEHGQRPGKAQFDRLLGLGELRRPLYGLVFDASHRLTTNLRSFGLLHRLGERPREAPTLAAQAEMRAEDANENGSLAEYRRASPESVAITQTLMDYRQVHPYASDRLAVLAVNVEDLRPLVAGVEGFLNHELEQQSPLEGVPYMISIYIIGRGPSPAAAQDVLRVWKESWSEERKGQRSCSLTLAYRPARNRKEVLTLLQAVDKSSDIGFLFNFLNDQTGGDSIVPVAAFSQDYNPGNIGKFPISEHPRLVQATDPNLRQGQVSNRRFRLAARHAELTARLKHPDHPGQHHLIFNTAEYGSHERALTARMHALARWVACMDRFVDKELILEAGCGSADQRKLVGFTSGVGAYGEFNLTLSTESRTAGELIKGTAKQLGQIYRDWSLDQCELAAQCLTMEAQAITGLSLVSALGNEGVMRDMIGQAMANRIYLSPSDATLCAAVPLDSFAHWFRGAEQGYVPDLLLLEAYLTGDIFTVEATVVECKVGQRSPAHVEEAVIQASFGLKHLSTLFLPNSVTERASDFDRRYWWAQLHRALVVRNAQKIQPHEDRIIEQALEQLAEGYFNICWRAVAATFWTDDDDEQPSLQSVGEVVRLLGTGDKPLEVYHASIGQRVTYSALQDGQTLIRGQIRGTPPARIEVDLASNHALSEKHRPHESDDESARLAHPREPDAAKSVESGVPASVPAGDEGATKSVYPGTVGVGFIQNPVTCVPERILLGNELSAHGGSEKGIYWEYNHPQLPNRHLLVFGGSGAGKTYAIQALLLEMFKAGQSSLIIDYTDGFLPQQLEPEVSETATPEHFVLAAGRKLPLDPFRAQSDEIEGFGVIQEQPFDVAKRVASIFTAVYSSLGEQQRATLVDRVEQGVAAGGLSLQSLYEQLRDEGEDLLANKLMPLARTEPFLSRDEEAWSALFEGDVHRINILQLARIPVEVQRLIIEFVLWDLWDYLRRTGNKNKPRPVVLDEVQNLDHRSGSPLEKYLREGRKFGASMILATQTMSNFRAEERDRLFQAAHMLFFSPAPTELRSFANVLKDRVPGSSLDDWSRQLSALTKGECLSVGYERRSDGSLRPQVRRVSITSLAGRLGAINE
ncbi:DUF87 domain-containing protein [Ectothiorhodospira haloalkaliphila]|uniref:ATP-binding protein n=1 Tax=Ectothiorhodospira haloalkaliphila TaxID=421628 RepID=UPI001EE8DE5B|nr:DUF87 domain-containing protein [Ectothiorhodospira haloalkaliphila]MCG5523612.1 DUF87 domain-containing protein [Ectothiorhodospira haloalkaliphila]